MLVVKGCLGMLRIIKEWLQWETWVNKIKVFTLPHGEGDLTWPSTFFKLLSIFV